jgi:hypothetical protein
MFGVSENLKHCILAEHTLSIKRVKLEHKTSQFLTRITSESDIISFSS